MTVKFKHDRPLGFFRAHPMMTPQLATPQEGYRSHFVIDALSSSSLGRRRRHPKPRIGRRRRPPPRAREKSRGAMGNALDTGN